MIGSRAKLVVLFALAAAGVLVGLAITYGAGSVATGHFQQNADYHTNNVEASSLPQPLALSSASITNGQLVVKITATQYRPQVNASPIIEVGSSTIRGTLTNTSTKVDTTHGVTPDALPSYRFDVGDKDWHGKQLIFPQVAFGMFATTSVALTSSRFIGIDGYTYRITSEGVDPSTGLFVIAYVPDDPTAPAVNSGAIQTATTTVYASTLNGSLDSRTNSMIRGRIFFPVSALAASKSPSAELKITKYLAVRSITLTLP